MFYSELVRKASIISFHAHKEDTDKGGYPYAYHPFFLAVQMEDEDSVCVALLHDVIEDHGDIYSFETLQSEGFNNRIIDALRLLTHDDRVPYMEYVKAISKDPIAKKVKIADLKHNLDASRINGQRTKKADLYREALDYLENCE